MKFLVFRIECGNKAVDMVSLHIDASGEVFGQGSDGTLYRMDPDEIESIDLYTVCYPKTKTERA